MADQLFGGTRIVQCKACGTPHLAKDMPIGLCQPCIKYIVTETPAAKRRAPATYEQRAAWYAANRTDVPTEMKRASRPWTRVIAWVVGKIWRRS